MTAIRLFVALFICSALSANQASAFWGKSNNNIEKEKAALLEALAILSEQGATASGPKSMALSRLVVEGFQGDENRFGSKVPECTFSALDEKGVKQNFKFEGEQCKSVMQKLSEAGFGSESSAISITYLACMIAQGGQKTGIVACEATKPLFE